MSQRERRGGRRTGEATTATTVPRLSRTGAFQFRFQHGNGHEVQHHQERTAQRAQTATATGKSVAVRPRRQRRRPTLFVAADCPSTADRRRRHRRRTISPHGRRGTTAGSQRFTAAPVILSFRSCYCYPIVLAERHPPTHRRCTGNVDYGWRFAFRGSIFDSVFRWYTALGIGFSTFNDHWFGRQLLLLKRIIKT